MIKFIIIIFLVIFISNISVKAKSIGAVVCFDHKYMEQTLKNRYKEIKQFMAIDRRNNLVEMFVSKRGSWTLVKTKPGHNSCIIDSGKSWVSPLIKNKYIDH